MASMTDYLEDALRDHVFLGDPYTPPTECFLALYESPTTDAGGGTEVTGGSYEAQPVTFVAGATGVAVSDVDVTFPDMPATTVTHVAVKDGVAGNTLAHGALSSPKTVTAGAPLTLPAGDVTFTFA